MTTGKRESYAQRKVLKISCHLNSHIFEFHQIEHFLDSLAAKVPVGKGFSLTLHLKPIFRGLF